MEGMTITLVEDIADLQVFFTWLSESREWLAVDVETDGLRWWDGKLRLVQFGDAKTAFAIPFEWYPKAVIDAINSYRGKLVGHNFKFDLHWLNRNCGFKPPWNRCYDTMMFAHLLEPHLRSGLKEVAKRHVHAGAANGDNVLKKVFSDNDWEWGTVPIDHPAYWKYAALDTILTARIAEKLYPRVQAARPQILDVELAVQKVLYNMEERGVMIDRAYTADTMNRFDDRINQFATWGSAYHGVSLGSNQQVVTRLVNMGWDFTKLTRSGATALDEQVLLEVMRDGTAEAQEFATTVRSFRKLRKMSGTYLANFLSLADSGGKLHCSIRQLGAKTGRMSVATPSLQNLPRNQDVRDCFIAREGHSLVLSDFSQIEVRLLAHFSQDPSLIQAILEGDRPGGTDTHTATARMIYNDPSIDKNDYRRQISKSSVFAKMYGAGIPKFALTAGISEDAARSFMAGYDAIYPGVTHFIGGVIATARNRLKDEGEGYATTPLGRRQTVGREKDDIFKLVNYLLQGSAADIMKTQLIALDAAGLGEFMTLPIHDEVILDVPDDLVDDVSHVVNQEMPITTAQYTVPITSDLTVVDRWGSKYEGQSSWVSDAFEDVFAEEIGSV